MSEKGSIRFVGILVALAVFAAFFELGRMDVVADNEGQRATPPAEMLRAGRFVVPTINGADYLAKPPLLYWVIAGVYTLTGSVSPFAARIPTAACYVALVACLYLAMRREAGESPARWGALALLASPYVLERARWASLDIPLTLATFLAIAGFRAACRADSGKRAALFSLLAGLALGAAMLLKGPAPLFFLGAAWIAQTFVTGTDLTSLTRHAAYGTLALLVVGIVLWLIGLLAPVRLPVALVLAVAFWGGLAWRYGGAQRARHLVIALAVIAVGIAVAAPWCLAVLSAKGWPYISALLHEQVIERTHTATRINSGSPVYYLVALPLMLAPWGFLLPCQFSKGLWERGSQLYRFSFLTGWLSVLFFSFIAGKEHEYVLPAVPFLLLVTGFHLSEVNLGVPEAWFTRWARAWRRYMAPFLAFLGVGGAVYIAATQWEHPALLVEVWGLGVVTLGLGVYGRRRAPRQLACVFAMALCVILMGMLSRSFYYTGQRSFKTIAATTGNLLRAGHEVQAVKMTSAFDVYPAFAFYTRTPVPTVMDAADVRERLEGDTPYFCVVRKRVLDEAARSLGEDLITPLMGPYTRKRLVLIGNTALPSDLICAQE